MSNCLSGCKYRGRHATGCHCATDHNVDHQGHCGGCLPRPAEHGRLCPHCWTRIQRDVRVAPEIVRWIREHIEPALGTWQERIGTGEVDAPAPLSVNSVDDADELHATVASWVLLVLDEHPSNLTLEIEGVRLSESTERLIIQPALKAWCDACGVVQESDSRLVLAETLSSHGHAETQIRPNLQPWSEVAVVPVRDAGLMPDSDATTALCKFLTTHLEWCSEQLWADEMVRELGAQVATLLSRYPQADRSHHMADVLCPSCGRSTMVYYPPAWFGSSTLVMCEHTGCGEQVAEDKFGHFMRLVEQQRREEIGMVKTVEIDAGAGNSLTAQEIIEALSQPGVIDYEIRTTGLTRPHVRVLRLKVNAEDAA